MLIMDTYNQLDVENNNAQTTGYTPTQATMSAFLLTDKKAIEYNTNRRRAITFVLTSFCLLTQLSNKHCGIC